MKKGITVILIGLIALNTFGVFAGYGVLRIRARALAQEMIGNAPASELTAFDDLDRNPNVRWEDPQKEFYYHGKMYDVARVEKKDGHAAYYCYDDQAELKIVHKVHNLVYALHGGGNTSHKAMVQLLIMLVQVFLPATPYSISPQDCVASATRISNPAMQNLRSMIVDIPLPPPRA